MNIWKRYSMRVSKNWVKFNKMFTLSPCLPTLLTLIAMGVSVLLLAMAVKQLPLGTAYAVWTGIGAVGTVLMGIWLFNEPATLARVLCLLLIIGGILGLKFIG